MSEVPLSVLAFSPYLPYPPDHGGRIRTFLLLRELVRRGHDVALVPLLDDEGERTRVSGLEEAGIRVEPIVHPRRFGTLTIADRVRKLANFARGRSDVLARFWSDAAVRASRSLGGGFDVVLAEVLWAAPLALAVEGAPRVLDTHNVEYVIADRTAEQTDGAMKRAAARLEARGLRKDEAHLLRGFESVICVSETDRDAITTIAPDVPIEVVGNCVDTELLQPLEPVGDGPPVCLFIGSANYPPNLTAVEHFATEVLPKVR
ncbi:MAG: glycosyltransferase, partial [Planctomycetes bacterium]|nr:glycosyltransferase [Planctomycetota bacterium]